MAAVAGVRRRPQPSLLARFAAKAHKVTTLAVRRVITPHRAVLRNLADIPLTVAGLGCIDAGVFVANLVAGLIVTGVSLILLEHLIADER